MEKLNLKGMALNKAVTKFKSASYLTGHVEGYGGLKQYLKTY